ncbi:hypothetical protein [Methanosarcina sp.]|uniref:hypothetical protein n=1 Tax=Methanosarcina sp. TaxID=2213 RepID=UPI003BB65CEE
MDKKDSQKSIWDQFKSLWNSFPEVLKLVGTILSIAIALKVLFPAAVLEINHFDAGPEIIEPGESSVLSWAVSRADNVAIEPDIGAVNFNGSISVHPSETTTYKLIATGDGEEKVALCTVTVKEEPQEPLLISSFDASPDSIKSGESAVLNWHVSGASKVNIEPGIGIVEPSGTASVSPDQTTTYKLTASNDDKEDVAYCTIAVEENVTAPEESITSSAESVIPAENNQTSQKNLPSIGSFNANPDIVEKGKSSVLTWDVTSATKVSIEPGIGTVSLTGSQRIFPDKNTTYFLKATNEAGSVDATKVVYVQESSTPPSSAPIPTPKQISPADGTVFDNSTSGATFKWTAVSGAANYTVEIDAYDSSSGSWLSESAGSQVISGISTTSYSFEFTAQGPGRWRAWAVGSDGQKSVKSGWWNFNYTV